MKKSYLAGGLVLAGVALVAAIQSFSGSSSKDTIKENKQTTKSETEESYSVVSTANSSWGSRSHGSEGHEASGSVKPSSKSTGTVEEVKTAQVERLVKTSGMAKRLTSMNAMIEQQLEALISDQELSEKDRSEFSKIFKENFDGQKLLAEYKQRLYENLSDQELEELESIYKDPNVIRYQQLNNDMMNISNMKENQDEFIEFMNYKSQNPTSEDRQALINKLDKATNASEQTTMLSMEILKSFVKDEDGPAGKEMEEEFLKEIKSAVTAQVQSGIEFTTRDMPDGEIADTANKLDVEAYRKQNLQMTEVVKGPMKRTFEKVSQLMDKNDPVGPIN